MLQEIIKTNAVAVAYEALSPEGKRLNKRQSFDVMSLSATSQDFYDLGKALGEVLEYAPKEITKTVVTILVEG